MLKKLVENKRILFAIITLFLLLIVCILRFTLSAEIENDLEIRPQSELIYYLNISYAGVDKNGLESSDSSLSNINSGVIYVEDVLPEGLTFNGFVESEDGTFGAASIVDQSICPGYVVDDSVEGENTTNNYHGLHYNPENRKVYFKIKNLQAGCILTIGIKTVTPQIDNQNTEEEETRRDFYNYASANEGELSVNSNTVHVWMGEEKVELHSVTYKYDDNKPSNAPDLPNAMQYAPNSEVKVAPDVNVEGYTFNGWKSTDITVNEDGTFTMPNNDVTFVGSFTENTKYEVSYKIEGIKPDEYDVPSTKQYYEGAFVKIDNTKVGEIFGNYRFMGWKIEDKDVEMIDKEYFAMPKKNVTIIGHFEELKYKVEYKFQGSVKPDNADSLLPEIQEYTAGSEVTLEEVKDVPEDYEFLGWYSDDSFIMPAKDIVIYGEWKYIEGYYAPTITKTIVDEKDYYYPGDIVEYKIVVTNNETFALQNIIIKEKNERASFISNEKTAYTVNSNDIVTIPTLDAGKSIEIKAIYMVTNEDIGTINNEVEILSSSSSKEHYSLDPSANLKAKDSFEVIARLTIKNIVNNNDKVFSYMIESEDGFSSSTKLKNGENKVFYLKPGKYHITELVPQGYTLVSVTGKVSQNAETFTLDNKNNYEIIFTNEFSSKSFYHSSAEVVNKVSSKKNIPKENSAISIKYESNNLKNYNLPVFYGLLTAYTNITSSIKPRIILENNRFRTIPISMYKNKNTISKINFINN